MNLFNKSRIPRRMWRRFTRSKFYNYIPDKWAVKIKYRNNFQKKLDLKNPTTFNEKLQWLKLYDRKPEYTTMVDKVEAKKYVASIIGEEYIIPTLGTWESFDEINFDLLPEQFVLKCTHSSGDVVVCKDKSTLDKERAKEKLEKSLHTDYYLMGREWPYKNVKRLIFAEEYIEDAQTQEARDYKFMCFHGVVKSFLVVHGRFEKMITNWYSRDRKLLPYYRARHSKQSPCEVELPNQIDAMIDFAELLSKEVPFLRVDFYCVNHKIYFGELTFYPASGFLRFNDDVWDRQMGSWIKLPDKKIK